MSLNQADGGNGGRRWALGAVKWLATGLAALLAACGGGGGTDGPIVSANCRPGLITGFAGAIGDTPLASVPLQPGMTVGEGDGGTGGGDGSVGGGEGNGIGGDDGQYRRVHVTIETVNGSRFGPWPVDDLQGMVTFVHCNFPLPAKVTFSGRADDATYYDEGIRRDQPFAGRQRIGLISRHDGNAGVTPLTHALYERAMAIGRMRGLEEGWKDPSVVDQAHAEILAAINEQLPGIYRPTDLTRLPVMLNASNDQDGSTPLTPNPNGVYGALIGGFAQFAATALPAEGGSALELADALIADLADGRFDLTGTDGAAIGSPTRVPYSFETLWSQLTVGTGAIAARAGAGNLKTDVVPIGYVRSKADAATTGGTPADLEFILGSNGVLVANRDPDAGGGVATKPAEALRFSQLYRFGTEPVVALRSDGLGVLVFPISWDSALSVEVAAPTGTRIVEMFDAGYPVLRLSDGRLMRLQGSSLVPEAVPPGVLNATCRSEIPGALGAADDAAQGGTAGTLCYGPAAGGKALRWRPGPATGVAFALDRVVQISGNERIVLALRADGSVLQLDADHAVRFVDAGGNDVTEPGGGATRQLVAAGAGPKPLDLPRICWLRAPFVVACDGTALVLEYREYLNPDGTTAGVGPITGARPLPIPAPVWRTRANRRLTTADDSRLDTVFIGVNGRAYDLDGRPKTLPLDGVPQERADQPPLAPDLAPITGDDLLTRAEAQRDLTLTGAAQAGSTVDVTLAGVARRTTADGRSAWQVVFGANDLPNQDGTYPVTVKASNPYGGSPVTSRTLRVVLSTAAAPTIAPIAGDDVVSSAEAAGSVTIAGTGQAGTTVTVSWNGRSRTASVGAGGGWSVGFAAAEIPAPGESQVTAVAANENGPGGSVTRTVRVQPAAPGTPVIAVVAGDDVVTSAEASGGVTISGTAAGGAAVAVDWQGRGKTATAGTGGAWNVFYAANEVPAAGATTVRATASNAGGSSTPATRTVQVLPAPVVPATPTIAVVADDDVVTPSEAKAGVAIRGTATGGDTVTVDWQGRGKTATANARG
ncbi:MAG: hypothetical protein AB7O55_36470, partial [Lautropia sp.]